MSRSEKEKMLAGELYFAADAELEIDRLRARRLLKRLNESDAEEKELRERILQELFGSCGKGIWIEPPFFCDYGYNIHLGDRVQINFNCIMLDVCRIEIGSDTLLAPGVHLYAATHPLDWKQRTRGGPEFGKPIIIGDDCWIGGGAIICPGITIGDRCVIGAGSMVTKNIPPDCLAVGNPARVVKKLDSNSG